MANRNIFSGFGLKSEFVNLIYQELMKGKFLNYADILSIYYGRDAGYYDRIACNSESGYGELKKAFPMVLKALEAKSPHSIMNNGKNGKGKAWRYVGNEIHYAKSEKRLSKNPWKIMSPFAKHLQGSCLQVGSHLFLRIHNCC